MPELRYPVEKPEPLGERDPSPPKPSEADGELLKEIRDDYRYFLTYWRENREEAAEDSHYAACEFWTPDELKEREDAGRPALNPDELSQYLKQCCNNLRQQKWAIQVNPKGSGATDDEATRRAAIIRGIEYRSGAQAAYTRAFEQAVSTGFLGAFRITTEYISKDSDEQEPRIRTISNGATVLPDPDARQPDFSDMKKCFVTDSVRKSTFAQRYPRAQKRSFNVDDANIAPDWIKGENITTAEYWRVEDTGKKKKIREREFGEHKVVQYVTNGLEILDKTVWIGSWIPIILVLGEERFINDASGAKRMFLSLIRRARGPQKMLAFIASGEAEEFGMSPKAPFLGLKGIFTSDEEAWRTVNKVPRAFLQYDIPDDWNVAWGPPPKPDRPQFIPNAAAYEAAYERWRRGVQAAMGITPLPTAAQRQNEKSGVALQRIQTQEAIGSFHFTDNFKGALENAGRQIDELITLTMDTPRHVGIRKPDDTHELLAVTASQHKSEDGQPRLPEGAKPDDDYLVTDHGEFDVTISTGPSYQSQREEASAFVDQLLANIAQLPPPGSPPARILAKAIRLKNLGPIGDELADILDPPTDQPIPPQAQAQMAQLKQAHDALNALLQQQEKKIQDLELEKTARSVEMQGKVQIAQAQEQTKVQLAEQEQRTKILIAEITTKAQESALRMKMEQEQWLELHGAAHDLALQKDQQAHEQQLAEQQAEQAQAAQAADQSHEQDMAAQQQAAAAQQQEQTQPAGA